jgi:hypothetical protein
MFVPEYKNWFRYAHPEYSISSHKNIFKGLNLQIICKFAGFSFTLKAVSAPIFHISLSLNCVPHAETECTATTRRVALHVITPRFDVTPVVHVGIMYG